MPNTSNTVKECDYKGVLGTIIRDFVEEKRAVGYGYRSERETLIQFSRFSESFQFPSETLTEEVVKAWIAPRPLEADRTRYSRFSIIKMLAEYMVRMGYTAYIPPLIEAGIRYKHFVPYIFTHEEVGRFFSAVDAMHPPKTTSAPRRHLVMPVLFRILYCCGLRLSEATGLRGEDVDLQSGILTIRNSKFGRSRYVPMASELTAVCAKYAETRLIGKEADWFFSARGGGRYVNHSVYSAFRDILREAGISHGGRGRGPRVHDFRHTFAVHCLQRWTADGSDITTALPYLREYLGHEHIGATEQYLRMTAEVYPEISELMQKKYGYIIPSGEGNAL